MRIKTCLDSLVDPGGPGGLGPLAPKIFKIMLFLGNFKGKTPVVSKFWAHGPVGVKTLLGFPDQIPGSAPGITHCFEIDSLEMGPR